MENKCFVLLVSAGCFNCKAFKKIVLLVERNKDEQSLNYELKRNSLYVKALFLVRTTEKGNRCDCFNSIAESHLETLHSFVVRTSNF